MTNAYLAVISARYRTLLQYRAAAFAGFVTQAFWGALKIMVLSAFFALSADEQPMTLAEVISYIWLGQAFLGMLPWSIDRELEALIRSGDVGYELVRPLDLYNFWFARTVALRTATTTLRAVPMIVIAMLVLPPLGFADWAMAPPPGWAAAGMFIVSLLCALLLACAFTMLMHIALVWTLSGDGLNRVMPAVTMIFSGMTVPLPLFPAFLQPLLEIQPFRGLVDVPFRIYSGNIAVTEAAPEILHQLVWTAVFVLLGRLWLRRSMHRVVVQGG